MQELRRRLCSVAVAAVACLTNIASYAADAPPDSQPIESCSATAGKSAKPCMKFDTLEDMYGDSGTSFQGSLGFFVSEGTPSDQPVSSFGVAIDDLVIEWREFRLDPDMTPCGNGIPQCATINISQTNGYEGNALVHVTVQDKSPYSPTHPVNDCNGDGDFTDVGIDDTDCNNNGVLDVTARLLSVNEPAGERAVLDRVGATVAYAVDFPVSSSYDSPGVLFIASSGTSNPRVRAQYVDRDDGTGTAGNDQPCLSNAAVEQRGLLEDGTTVFLSSGQVTLKSVRLTDNGDNDGFADTNETVSMYATIINKSGQDLSDVVATLQSSDPKIECISGTTAKFTGPGNPLPDNGVRESLTPFVFRVKGTTQRSIVNERFVATFQMVVRSERFDVTAKPITIRVELDLNAIGGGAVIGYSESFESNVRSNFVTFTSTGANLDANKASLALSDGYRCQYNDPDGPNTNSPNRPWCYMGFVNAADNGYDWHIHSGGPQDNNLGRAYVGTRSLHFGVHPTSCGGGAKRDKTRFAQLDGLRSLNALNLPLNASSELSFKHQVSFTDNRTTRTPDGETADRGVVAIQLADSNTGAAFGQWIKIYPYENEYDAQGTDEFSNCTFDPIDDGNDEDDFFDPSDPLRRLGPSSTCFPEFTFSFAGDTDWQRSPGDMSRIGRADGPGLRGQIDLGTWVQPKFLLDEFKGRRIRLRFLATTIEVNGPTISPPCSDATNTPGDDGWYIDDVQIPQVIQTPVLLSVDNAANSGLPGCSACTTITPSLLATPAVSPAPGQPVVVDARASTADACPSGNLQFKFWYDANGSNTIEEAFDLVLRDWTDNPIYNDAPSASIASTIILYAVQVRCSTNYACGAPAAFANVTVNCPSTGTLPALPPFDGPIGFTGKSTITWTNSQIFEAIRGNLTTLRSSSGNFSGTVKLCLADGLTGTSVFDTAIPVAGTGFYYLTRSGAGACNQPATWSTNDPREQAGRDAEIGADPSTCP